MYIRGFLCSHSAKAFLFYDHQKTKKASQNRAPGTFSDFNMASDANRRADVRNRIPQSAASVRLRLRVIQG